MKLTQQQSAASRRLVLGGSLGALTASSAAMARAAAAASTSSQGQAAVTVAGLDAPESVKGAAQYVCDGVADDVEINAALASVGADKIGHGNNGGAVILAGRAFWISNPIRMQTQTSLRGAYGRGASKIMAAANFPVGGTAAMVRLATSSTQYVEISDLALHGRGLAVNGIFLDTQEGQEWDSFHVVRSLYIYRVGLCGIRLGAGVRNRGNHLSDVRIIDAGQHGVSVECTDNFLERVDAGSSGVDGFHIAASNNRVVNCKAWFSDRHGFHITAPTRDNQLAACEAQDNQEHGFAIMGSRTVLAACCADSNGYGSVNQGGDGFYVIGNGTNLEGSASDKNEGNRGRHQRYGVHIASRVAVIVNVTTSGNKTAPRYGTPSAGSIVNVVNS